LITTQQVLQQIDKATTLRIAQQMLKTNANIDFIMQVTGLNADEIKQLQDSESF
jgi:predicted transposase YdaD